MFLALSRRELLESLAVLLTTLFNYTFFFEQRLNYLVVLCLLSRVILAAVTKFKILVV